MPEWERRTAKEAKGEETAETKEMGFKELRAWARKKLHLQVRTLGHLAFWANLTANTPINGYLTKVTTNK